MTMPKKYIITESQLKALVEKKRVEKITLSNILEAIKTSNGKLNESSAKDNGIVTILKKHTENGPMSKSLIESLLSSKLVTMEHLTNADVKTSGML